MFGSFDEDPFVSRGEPTPGIVEIPDSRAILILMVDMAWCIGILLRLLLKSLERIHVLFGLTNDY